jgi:EAL domain-containing protein (putative c-di-GMP-specific phosphodiesterase class I)
MSVSAVELRSKGFADNVRAILRDSGLGPQFLEIELPEAVLHRDFHAVHGVLHDLKDLGVRLALDNFGTGVSSLSYLKRVPLDTLKIDRSLVRGMCTSANDASIVDAVISAGRCFHLRVVADGVETRGQFLALQSRQCAEGQGPYFLDPVPMNEFTKLRTGASTAAPVE